MRGITVGYQVFGYTVIFEEKPVWKGKRCMAYTVGNDIVIDSTCPAEYLHRVLKCLMPSCVGGEK